MAVKKWGKKKPEPETPEPPQPQAPTPPAPVTAPAIVADAPVVVKNPLDCPAHGCSLSRNHAGPHGGA